jgi:hypothetical protein
MADTSTMWGGYPGRGAWRYPNHYGIDNCETPNTLLNYLAHGEIALAVKGWQKAIAGHQFACPVNGSYDLATHYAVVAFQKSRGTWQVGPLDGIIGRKTARAIIRPYIQFFQKANGIPDNLACGQIAWESGGYDNGAEGQLDDRDRGLVQINSYFRANITDEQAYDPLFSIPYHSITMYHASLRLGAMRPTGSKVDVWDLAIAFNKGPSAAEKWARTGIAPEGYEEYVYNVRVRALQEA